MDVSDAALVEECLSGCQEAFAKLVERHQDAVYNLAYRKTGHASDAGDLAQEVFIRAYRKLDSYDSTYSFRNWVLGICANQTRNFFRGLSRRRRVEEQHLLQQEIETAPGSGAGSDSREKLEKALQELPEKMRIPLVMKYMEGFSYEEIARILKIGLSAVKMRILRGRDELAERMMAMDGGGA